MLFLGYPQRADCVRQVVGRLMPGQPYEIQCADEAAPDLRATRAFDQRIVLEGIELHLLHQPRFVSKSRIKLMKQPFWSQYRLRLADFRTYCDVDANDRVVGVLRILRETTDQTTTTWPGTRESKIRRSWHRWLEHANRSNGDRPSATAN